MPNIVEAPLCAMNAGLGSASGSTTPLVLNSDDLLL